MAFTDIQEEDCGDGNDNVKVGKMLCNNMVFEVEMLVCKKGLSKQITHVVFLSD